ncbi:MAG TPA: hypothetical protein VE078_02970 [Thermoanaerobaculia bacterium]|nr:hypothetical protein [Thermoanaerobaculia bacterium]
MRDLLLGFLAALLPAPERGDFARRHGVDPIGWSGLLGLAEFLGGGLLMVANGLAFFQRVAERNATLFIDSVESASMSREELTGYMLSGVANWLEWLAQPWTWLLFLIPATGLLRLVAYGLHHEASGEPLVWAGVRLWQLFGRGLGQSRDLLRFGPDRPDRIEPSPGGLTVLSCRPKDWNPLITIEIRERFYRLLRAEERQDGQWWVHAYELGEVEESEVIRYLIRYDPDWK